jgi:glycosyltransferase involved in cell wall biosynthesis
MTQTTNPTARIAVIMAAYNAEATIRRAVQSVLDAARGGAATTTVDLFVVDDASRVPVAGILETAPNLHILRLSENCGPGAARNHALERILAADYAYVAIVDADDAVRADRFAAQAAFLDAHPEIGAVGSAMQVVTEQTFEPVYQASMPAGDDDIRTAMFSNLALLHPTLMARTALFRKHGGYDTSFVVAEDYEMLRRFQRHTRFANLPVVLVDYRLSQNGQSLGRRRRQLWDRLRVQLRYFAPLDWRAWAGVAKTLVLFATPVGLVTRLKARRTRAVPA